MENKFKVLDFPKQEKPPEKWEWCWLGFHKWGKWICKFEGSSFQRRECSECGKMKERMIW